jgi:hypothetical protein
MNYWFLPALSNLLLAVDAVTITDLLSSQIDRPIFGQHQMEMILIANASSATLCRDEVWCLTFDKQ